MRWLIGLLVVVNLVLLLWQFQVDRPETERASATLPEVGNLRLLGHSEIPSGQGGKPEPGLESEPETQPELVEAPGETEVVIADEPLAGESPAGEALAEEPVVEEPTAEEPGIEEPVTEEPVAEERAIEEPVTEEPVTEEPIVEEPAVEEPIASTDSGADEETVIEDEVSPLLPEGPELAENQAPPAREADVSVNVAPELSSGEQTVETPRPAPEATGPIAEAGSVPANESAPEMAQKTAVAVPVCWRLGLFDTQEEAKALAARLPAGVKELEIEPVSQRLPNGYYVLLPPLPDRASALRLERRLKAKGIEDSWVFPNGPLKNAISLGVYSREVNARRHLKKVEAKGFEPELRPRYRTGKKFALLLTGPADEATGQALEALGAGALETVACPDE